MAKSLADQITQCQAQIEEYEQKIEQLRESKPETPLQSAASNAGISDSLAVSKMKCRKRLAGHFGKIYGMDWAPDSEKLVSAAQDGKLIVWNALSESMLCAVSLQSSWVMACAFSPNGKMVASGGLDNWCSVFNLDFDSASNTQGPAHVLDQHEGYLSCCKFIGNEEMLTSSGDQTCILWDIATATAKTKFNDHESDVMCIAPFENSNLFVSGSCDSTAKLWDYRAGDNCLKTFIGHESDINGIKAFPGGNMFGSASDDSICKLFDIRSYGQVNQYRDDHIIVGITSCDFSSSGRIMFAGYDDYTCQAWDTLTGAMVQTLNAHENRVSCLGVNKTGQALCTGSWSMQLKIWA